MNTRLAIIMGILCVLVPPARAAAQGFADVPPESWFAPYVEQAVRTGLASGYRDVRGKPSGYFGPADPVTIVQAYKMELVAAGADMEQYRLVAPRTGPAWMPETWWHLPYKMAESQGATVQPICKDAFDNFNRPMYRWEMARLIADVYGLIPATEPAPALPNPFSDLDVRVKLYEGSTIPIPNPQTVATCSMMNFTGYGPDRYVTANRYAILRLVQDGVLSRARTFRPLGVLTRAEAVKMLLKAQATYSNPRLPREREFPNSPPTPEY